MQGPRPRKWGQRRRSDAPCLGTQTPRQAAAGPAPSAAMPIRAPGGVRVPSERPERAPSARVPFWGRRSGRTGRIEGPVETIPLTGIPGLSPERGTPLPRSGDGSTRMHRTCAVTWIGRRGGLPPMYPTMGRIAAAARRPEGQLTRRQDMDRTDPTTPTPRRNPDPQPSGAPRTIAVIGSTGRLGRSTVEAFAARGHRVLACARGAQQGLPAGAEARVIDVTRPETLIPALDGAEAVHLSLSGGSDPERIRAVEDEGVRRVAQAAEQLGVTRISMISGMYARPEFAEHPGEGAKLRAEQHLLAARTPATIFRPGFFAETLESFVQNGRGMLLGSQPHTLHPIISADLMDAIARSYAMPEAQDRVFEVTGREPMTLRSALRRYLEATRPGAGVSVMPLWFMGPVNRLFMKGELTRALDTMGLLQAHGEIADPTTYFQVFGTRATPFDVWLEQQAERAS